MLNPDLDVGRLADEFRGKKRLLITDIFQTEIAERLYECLEKDVPWGIAYIDNGTGITLSAEKVMHLSREEWAAIHATVNNTPVQKFQYLYNTYPMIPPYLEKRDLHLCLHQLVEYFNSSEFIGFMRAVTGVTNITNTDAQATRYIPGCFLRKHSDFEQGKGRELAYVLNLTKGWYPEFGGLLQFIDKQDAITETYSPVFNSLSLFRVPAWHQVSYVVPYANRPRYAITGWVRSGSALIPDQDSGQ